MTSRRYFLISGILSLLLHENIMNIEGTITILGTGISFDKAGDIQTILCIVSLYLYVSYIYQRISDSFNQKFDLFQGRPLESAISIAIFKNISNFVYGFIIPFLLFATILSNQYDNISKGLSSLSNYAISSNIAAYEYVNTNRDISYFYRDVTYVLGQSYASFDQVARTCF